MNVDNKALRGGIIEKLKLYDAYIDNELPDYIMVMIANRKTLHQINNDLRLFLGEHTDKFTDWLQDTLNNPESLNKKQQKEDVVKSTVSPERTSIRTGTKRPSDRDILIRSKAVKQSSKDVVQRVKSSSSRESDASGDSNKPPTSRDQDLRSLIRRRRAGATATDVVSSQRPSRRGRVSDDDDDQVDTVNTGSVASVVQLPEKQPRLRGAGGTGRLLQRAIQGIHGKSSSKAINATTSTKSVRRARTTSRETDKQTGEATNEDLPLQEDDFVDEFREETEKVAAYNVLVDEEEEDDAEEPVEDIVHDRSGEGVSDSEEKEGRKPAAAAAASPRAVEAAMLAAVKKVLPGRQDTVDLREVLNKTKKEEGTKFVVTMEGIGDKYSYVDELPLNITEEEQGGEEEPLGSGGNGASSRGMPERCRFWPNCKNGDTCPYFHPKTPCRLFPNCKYGNKCLFVHPQCKFDARCTKPDCPFMHTTQRTSVVPAPSIIPMAPGIGMGIGTTGPFTYPGPMMWPRQTRYSNKSAVYPNKSALSWSPAGRNQPTRSERQFAVPDDQSTRMSVQ